MIGDVGSYRVGMRADAVVQLPRELGAVSETVWGWVARGVKDRRHGYHMPIVSTVTAAGEPSARMVVLRRVEVARRLVMCHTDVRSVKCEEVRGHRAHWTFYDPGLRMQVRAWGRAWVEAETGLADEQWAGTTLSARRCYLAPRVPGLEAEGPDVNVPAGMEGRVPTAEEAAAGRVNFGVFMTEVEGMDVLHLAADGHVRVRLEWVGGILGGSWVAV